MISIIIPLYNKETSIEQTIKSVLSQNYDDYEIIVVDDGSTDNSLAILSQIAKANHDKIRIIQQSNGGPSKARNVGIQESCGEWLYCIDADDEMMPGTLSHFSHLLDFCQQADLIFGEQCFFDGKNTIAGITYKDHYIRNPYKEHALGRLLPCSGTVFYKRTLCEQILYNEEIRRYEDLECMLRKFRSCKLYTTHFCFAKIHTEYASASKGRNNIYEDFMGHLTLNGVSFWEKINIYQFFLSERPYYWEEAKKLYPYWFYRYDLLILSKVIKHLSFFL